MSSDSENKFVVAGSSAENVVQRKKVREMFPLFGNIFRKKMQILLVYYAI